MTEWDDNILIGEGVELATGAAPVTLRMLSAAIDAILYAGALTAAIVVLSNSLGMLSGAWQGAAVITLVVTFLVIIPATVETLSRGRSLGRLALGLRVVRDDGGPIAFRHALGRAFTGILEIYATFGMVAVTVSVLSTRGKRMGDVVVGTFAMRLRGGTQALPPVMMPDALKEWASNADMRRLPDGMALTARIFLARVRELDYEPRARIGTAIATALHGYVSPDPPPGTHPEAYIAAVLATRRDREYAFESRRSQRVNADLERLARLPYDMADAQ